MILQVLHCPHYRGTDIVRHGQARQGKQRYRNLRTQIKRLVRRTTCFSKDVLLQDGAHAQSHDWTLHQSIRIRTTPVILESTPLRHLHQET
jgi:transposase-like protein